jgi:hypothetical protein
MVSGTRFSTKKYKNKDSLENLTKKHTLRTRDPRSGIRKNSSRIQDPGGKKHRIPDLDMQHWVRVAIALSYGGFTYR